MGKVGCPEASKGITTTRCVITQTFAVLRVIRRLFAPKRGQVTGGWKELYKDELRSEGRRQVWYAKENTLSGKNGSYCC
jgi:hypothetical protein